MCKLCLCVHAMMINVACTNVSTDAATVSAVCRVHIICSRRHHPLKEPERPMRRARAEGGQQGEQDTAAAEWCQHETV